MMPRTASATIMASALFFCLIMPASPIPKNKA